MNRNFACSPTLIALVFGLSFFSSCGLNEIQYTMPDKPMPSHSDNDLAAIDFATTLYGSWAPIQNVSCAGQTIRISDQEQREGILFFSKEKLGYSDGCNGCSATLQITTAGDTHTLALGEETCTMMACPSPFAFSTFRNFNGATIEETQTPSKARALRIGSTKGCPYTDYEYREPKKVTLLEAGDLEGSWRPNFIGDCGGHASSVPQDEQFKATIRFYSERLWYFDGCNDCSVIAQIRSSGEKSILKLTSTASCTTRQCSTYFQFHTYRNFSDADIQLTKTVFGNMVLKIGNPSGCPYTQFEHLAQ